jgi:hypothetical protein
MKHVAVLLYGACPASAAPLYPADAEDIRRALPARRDDIGTGILLTPPMLAGLNGGKCAA